MADLVDGGPAEVEFGHFDIGKVKPGKTVILIGRRGSGKTVLLRHLMYVMRHKLHSGVAMAPTTDSRKMFREFMPASFVYPDYNDDAVRRVQKTKQDMQDKLGGEDADPYNVFVLMDDCMFDKKATNSREMRRLFMNGRHVKVFFVNLMQYCLDMGPSLRTNCDYVFAFEAPELDNRLRLWKYFFGMFASYQEFEKVYTACTGNYECMVLDNTCKSNVVTDKVFYFRASVDIPRFRVGAKSWWLWDWKYGRRRNAQQTAAAIDKDVHNAYAAGGSADKDTLNTGLPKTEFTVIKAPKRGSVFARRNAFAGGARHRRTFLSPSAGLVPQNRGVAFRRSADLNVRRQ